MLVAATSLGPVPQSLWMMASILDEECAVVNVNAGTGHGQWSHGTVLRPSGSADPLAHGGSG
jgi:hypothetical protein